MASATKTDVTARHRGTLKLATDEPTLDTSDLRYDYEQIEDEHRDKVRAVAVEILAHGRRAKESVVAMGQRLIDVKAILPAWTFTAWLTTEFELSERMAQNMMNVARQYGERPEIISVLNDTVLYLLAAPSTPEEVRAEIEQRAADGEPVKVADVRESKQAHVAKVAAKFAEPKPPKAKPEPVQFAGIDALADRVRVWLVDTIGEGGDPSIDSVLESLTFDAPRPIKKGSWMEMLEQSILAADVGFLKIDMIRALDKVREQRRTAARQAQAAPSGHPPQGAVYVEPRVAAGSANDPTPEDLVAAGYRIVRSQDDRSLWMWLDADGTYGDAWPIEQAVADARKRIELAPPAAGYRLEVNFDDDSTLVAVESQAAPVESPPPPDLPPDLASAGFRLMQPRPGAWAVVRDEPSYESNWVMQADIDLAIEDAQAMRADEQAAIAAVAAEQAAEDEERAERDAGRAPHERTTPESSFDPIVAKLADPTTSPAELADLFRVATIEQVTEAIVNVPEGAPERDTVLTYHLRHLKRNSDGHRVSVKLDLDFDEWFAAMPPITEVRHSLMLYQLTEEAQWATPRLEPLTRHRVENVRGPLKALLAFLKTLVDERATSA